jgi:hypothetical protein
LLDRVAGLFFLVIPRRSKNRHSVPMPTRTPWAASPERSSARVMPPLSSSIVIISPA